MNKKVLIVIGAVLLLLVGGYLYMNSRKGTGTSNEEQPSAATSLKNLIAKGVAQNCTYSTEQTSGSVYVSGGAVRGDFETTVDKVVTKSHMIVKDNTSYIWSDGQTTGFKMSFDPNATPAGGETSSKSDGNFDISADMNYKCSTWIVDGSKFALPAGVTFSAFEIPTTDSSSSQCSYCNSLSGDDKTQCLTALKCK